MEVRYKQNKKGSEACCRGKEKEEIAEICQITAEEVAEVLEE